MKASNVNRAALTPFVNLGHNIRFVQSTLTSPRIDTSLTRESRRSPAEGMRNLTQWVTQRLQPSPRPPVPSSLNPAARLNAMKPFAEAIRKFVAVKGGEVAPPLLGFVKASAAFLRDFDAIDKDKGLEAYEAQQFRDAVRNIVEQAGVADSYLSREVPYEVRDEVDNLLAELGDVNTKGYALLATVMAEKLDKPAPLSDAEKQLGFGMLVEMPQSDELSEFRNTLRPWLDAHLARKSELTAAVSASDPEERNLRLEQTHETLQKIHDHTIAYAAHAEATMPKTEGHVVDHRVQALFTLINKMESDLAVYSSLITTIETQKQQDKAAPATFLEKRFGFEVLAQLPDSRELSAFRDELKQLLRPYAKTVDGLKEAIEQNRPERFKLLGQAYTKLQSIQKLTYRFAIDLETLDGDQADPRTEKLFDLVDEMHEELKSFWGDMSAHQGQMVSAGFKF